MRISPSLLFKSKIVFAAFMLTASVSIHPCGFAETPTPAGLVEQKNVVFATPDGVPLHMDIVQNKLVNIPSPVVICIHGGGWYAGNKDELRNFQSSLAFRGFTTASIEYRFAPKYKFPSQLEDVRAAVKYLREHAKKLNLNTEKFGALGISAGGHLAMLLAEGSEDGSSDIASKTHPSALKAAVAIAGPVDLTATDLSKPGKEVVLGLMGEPLNKSNEARYHAASPLFCLSSSCPPLLLINGDKDTLVPYSQATRMIEASTKCGVHAELFTLHNVGHGTGAGSSKELGESMIKITDFLMQHLQS